MTMQPHYDDDATAVYLGDCIEVMRSLPDESIDAIVTDPPYGLGFMGKEWDALPPGLDWALECYRVLKPGGHLLAFGGTRTWHRLAVAVEDAGFELRDSIAWLYGSGFPKSMDVSKAIDKLDAVEERRARALRFTEWMRSTGLTARRIDDLTRSHMGGHYTTPLTQPLVATADHLAILRPHLPPVPEWVEALVAEREVESQNHKLRKVIGERVSGIGTGRGGTSVITDNPDNRSVTVAHTPDAERWQGWGTALKPAFEPVVVGRKLLSKGMTVAANVLAHGTGALNIDGARVGSAGGTRPVAGAVPNRLNEVYGDGMGGLKSEPAGGRWPANVMLDESQAAALDAQAPKTGAQAQATGTTRTGSFKSGSMAGGFGGTDEDAPFYGPELGGASRFFYVAKAPKSERPVHEGLAHATVKPLSLMRQLVRLVTPPGGTVLEPFAGSGTTVEACIREGFKVIAVEREVDYWPLIRQRIARGNDVELP